MLKIVRCGLSASARKAFCDRIAALTAKGISAYLIVPEQQTVMAEGMMAKILPPSAALTFEVTNFTRLANTTFRSLGGLSGEYCDPTKKALIMWRTLSELSPILSITGGRSEINSGLVSSALSAVAEMQNLGITPDQLSESSELDRVREDARLCAKLRDLSEIYALYKKLLGERYSDSGDDAEAMIKRLNENPAFLSDTHIFIDGFTSFTEPQYRLIGLLAARTAVSVSLSLPKGREESFEFSEILECQHRLSSVARKQGADVGLVREEISANSSPEELTEICRYLWSTIEINEKISLQNPDTLRIFEAKTPYDECSFICEDIQRRVMMGASYGDFAIVARSAEKYSGILDTALDRAKIPSFTSYRADVQELEAIKLIYTAYAIARGFAREDVISYAKCGLSGVERRLCDEFESYVNKWQISGKRFTDGQIWNMNPDGYTVRRPEGADEKLLRIHSVRERIINPLSRFSARTKAAGTVAEQARVLLDFLLEIGLDESLKKRSQLLLSMGEDSLAYTNSVLWRTICDALDTLVTVLGDMPSDSDSFLAQLRVVFSSTDIGRIPAYVDRVTVGSADMLRLYDKPYIYLIGVNAGEFPATVSDGVYFSERDRRLLSELGLSIKPDQHIRGARELYVFTRAFSYATKGVTLSYCSANTAMKAIEPSDAVGRISNLCGISPVKLSSLGTAERIYTPSAALEGLGELGDDYGAVIDALGETGHGEIVSVAEGSIINSSAGLGKSIVGASGRLSLSQTRIDSFVNCPFGYFCRYTIGLKEDERAEFDARGIGSFVHAVLENFFRSLSDEGRHSDSLDADERHRLTRRAAEKYVFELGEDVINASQRTRIKIDRLCRAAMPVVDGLCEELAASRFEPRFFELALTRSGIGPAPISLENDGGVVSIYGIIDRVDAYKRGDDVYLRVIDYKTGHKEFSPDDMEQGANLQMFLYLKSLVESESVAFRDQLGLQGEGRLIPAGVIYVKTAVGDVRVDTPDDLAAEAAVKGAQGREGMILDDPDVISAMNVKYTPLYSSRTPDKIPESKRKFLYDEDGWAQIMETVEGSVLRVADEIRSGEMPATPRWQNGGKSACEYCPYKPVCRKVEK